MSSLYEAETGLAAVANELAATGEIDMLIAQLQQGVFALKTLW